MTMLNRTMPVDPNRNWSAEVTCGACATEHVICAELVRKRDLGGTGHTANIPCEWCGEEIELPADKQPPWCSGIPARYPGKTNG